MAPEQHIKRSQESEDEYDAQEQADDGRPQRLDRGNATESVDQNGPPRLKASKIGVNATKEDGGEKPKTASKGGVMYTDDGTFQYYDPKSKQWIPAAYHNDHRQEFLEEDAPQDGFVWQPQRGFAEFDETSHMEIQRSWNAEELDKIVDTEGRKVMFDLDRPRPSKPGRPGYWMLGDKVLLDHNNRPIKAWRDLNKTLSTEIEDWRWEAIRRLYPWITTADLLARMPHFRQKEEDGEFLPLQSSCAFTNRAMRFRQPKAIAPVNRRKGTEAIVDYMRKHIEKHNAETAEEVPELTSAELKKAKQANKGKFFMNSRYADDENNTSKSGKAKRKAKNGSDDSADHVANSSAKRIKREHRSSSPLTRDGQRIYAPIPTPHGRADRIRRPSEENRSASDNLADREMTAFVPHTVEDEVALVPLFVSLSCEELATVQDPSYTTPMIVLQAKANGCTMLDEVDVRWYDARVERERDRNNVEHPNVVMREEWEAGLKLRWNGADHASIIVPGHYLDQLPARPKIEAPSYPIMLSASSPSRAPPRAPPAAAISPQMPSPLPPPQSAVQRTPSHASSPPLAIDPVALSLRPDDQEGQQFEQPWRQNYGPFGF